MGNKNEERSSFREQMKKSTHGTGKEQIWPAIRR